MASEKALTISAGNPTAGDAVGSQKAMPISSKAGDGVGSEKAMPISGGSSSRRRRLEEAALNAKLVDLVDKGTRPDSGKHKTAVGISADCCVDGVLTDEQETLAVLEVVPSVETPTPVVRVGDKKAVAPPRLTWGRKPRLPRPHLDAMSQMPTCPPRRAHRSLAKPKMLTIDPVIWQGVISVPEAAVSGDDAVDEKNAQLAECYSTVSVVLKVKHVSALIAKVKGKEDIIMNKSVIECVSSIRRTSSMIRAEVRRLGGTPLGEPIKYWREKYYLAKF